MAGAAYLPFDLFPRQADLVRFIDGRVKAGEDGVVKKSREIGFTYVTGGYAIHKWLFHRGFKTAFASRNTDLVDQMGNSDSIFEKLRIMIDGLPPWMRPPGFKPSLHSNYKRILNPATGDVIVGEGGDEIGRGGRNSLMIIDEAAFLANGERVERSTSANSGCRIWGSTVNRADDFFSQKVHSGRLRDDQVFTYEFRQDPRKDAAWEATERARLDPRVFDAEYGINFNAFAGDAFFDVAKLLVDNEPVDVPQKGDTVFAVVDTATKTGKENDGTGVVYCLLNKRSGVGPKIIILDWDLAQIEGSLLEMWVPSIFSRLEQLVVEHRPLFGSIGTFIEDKSTGMVLIQQAARKEWPVHAIESRLTSMGKDERAVDVSGYVHRGECKISKAAFDKQVQYKGVTRNHLLGQVKDFRLGGGKDAAKRADDLLDCFCYSLIIGLGESKSATGKKTPQAQVGGF